MRILGLSTLLTVAFLAGCGTPERPKLSTYKATRTLSFASEDNKFVAKIPIPADFQLTKLEGKYLEKFETPRGDTLAPSIVPFKSDQERETQVSNLGKLHPIIDTSAKNGCRFGLTIENVREKKTLAAPTIFGTLSVVTHDAAVYVHYRGPADKAFVEDWLRDVADNFQIEKR